MDPSSKWLYTAGLAFAAVGLATLGWFLGPPPKKKEEHRSGGPPNPKDHQKEEKKLQTMIQNLSEACDVKNYPKAEKLAQEALDFTESVWGKKHLNYGIILGIPVAKLYQLKEDYLKWANALLVSTSILVRHEHGEEMLMELGLLDKLIQCLPYLKEYSKTEEYAKMCLRLRKEAFNRNSRDTETFLKYSQSSVYILKFYNDAGKFRQAEALYTEMLEVYLLNDPSSQSAYDFLELYSNCLYQQGKTEMALHKLEEYKKEIENYKDDTFIDMVHKILLRALTLSFLIDDYQLCFNYMQQIIKHVKENQRTNLLSELQTIMDFATILFEFGKNEEAEKYISQIQSIALPPKQLPPLAKSRYLTTMDYRVQSGVYKLTMRVNRICPKRREGEQMEEVKDIRRKLDHCFLVVYFQNTSSAEPVIAEYPVENPHEFLIESPPMSRVHKANTWYKVHIEIYANSKKSQKLGSHEQPVYTFPLT